MNTEHPVSIELLQQFLDASGIGWWCLDFEKREMTCSPLATELFGTDRTHITFDEVRLLPREEHRARIYTRCAALKVTDTLDETFVTANGNRCLQVKAVEVRTDPRTNIRTAFGSVRRVTSGNPESAELAAINQSYKAAQRNYSHLAQLIEHLPIGYIRINILRNKAGEAVDYLLSYINQQAGRILGIRTQDFTGKTAVETGADPQESLPRFLHIPSGDSREHLWQAPASERICRTLIYNTPGDDDELVILLEDVTEATRSEEQLRRAKERAEESNRLKSAFLANMSHEIRTPLNAIVGFSELLANEPDNQTRGEYSDIIRHNNELLLQIISDVLDLALIESGRSEVIRTIFDAREFIRETVEVFHPQCPPGVELRMEKGLPPLPIWAYRQGVTRIIGNYLRNALKFTREGSITVGFREIPGYIRFHVRDTGIGIAPEDHGRIFERFVKLDTFTQGTGLGLSICKSIAEQLGGRVGVDSAVGRGSCFRLDVPVRK